MILTEKVLIRMNAQHITKYRNKGYVCKKNEITEVKVEDLLDKSTAIVKVKCDICGQEKELKYYVYRKNFDKYNCYSCSIKCASDKSKQTILDKYGVDNPAKSEKIKNKIENTNIKKYGTKTPAQNSCIKEKMQTTCLNKYGVKNSFQSEEIKGKIKIINLEKYGVINPGQSEEIKQKIKNTKIKNLNQIPDIFKTDYQIYRRDVVNETNLIKYKLFTNWNGYDYYDGEYIFENFNLDPNDKNYPTIDHKISVYFGFINGIPVEDISKLDNLCITKRRINSSKNKLNENEYNI